ncbi:hypothetical protein [Planctomyces sp. SH-PL14]|uniref:hypothetical protein n=1 Tax=Planctomyces sp. SH-PL14 TaxID=1632864 RepID=UPI00078C6FB7|nr:hypothetical protein [Planctomyces sp. SH-PL14]AMV16484.1 hypothetical protein VT03_01250 [Planctomyces sp. SH-PL14]
MTTTRFRSLLPFLLLGLILPPLLGRSAAAESKRLGYRRLALVAKLEAIDKTAEIAKGRIALAVPETKLQPDQPFEFELARLPRGAAPGDLLTCFSSKYYGLVWIRSPVGDAAAWAELLKLDDPKQAREVLRRHLDHLEQETACGDLVYLRLRQLSLREVFDLKAEGFLDTACSRMLKEHDPELSSFYSFLIAGCGDKGTRFLTENAASLESDPIQRRAIRAARIAVLGQQEITSVVDSALSPRKQVEFTYAHFLAIQDHIPLGFVPREAVLSEIARLAANEQLCDLAITRLKDEKHWTACDLILQAVRPKSFTPAQERATIRFLRAMQRANGGESSEEKARLAQATGGLEDMKRRFPQSYDDVEEGERLEAEFERERREEAR